MKTWLIVLMTGSLLAAPAPRESETLIRFTLVSHIREGLIFSRRTVSGIPLFELASFAGDEDYARRLLKKTEFDAALNQLERAFRDGSARPGCPRRVTRERISERRVLRKDSICLDAEGAKAYEAARLFLN